MDRYFGFDLGDAESAISKLDHKGQVEPEIVKVRDAGSFITAFARLRTGELIVGESACYTPNAVERKLRFKSRFLTDPQSAKDIKSFIAATLGELYLTGELIKNEDCSFYVGCPAGWDKNAREHYRQLFEQVGYPPARIISESRAALVSACQSKHLQVGYDILSKPVLVVDMGSSTTDFAYISNGKEIELQTAGEVFLGGGIMDEILLAESVEASNHSKKIKEVLDESGPWRSYCEFAARRLKEKYFSDEEYWENNECKQTVMINYKLPIKLTIKIDKAIAEKLLNKKVKALEDKSFKEVFVDSLNNVRNNISGTEPELIFLTGGVSKLPYIRELCTEAFPNSIVISGAEPEYSVSRGLAWCGRIDDDLKAFKNEVKELIDSTLVENTVEKHIDELFRSSVDVLVEPILENTVIPVFDRWRKGDIIKLSEINGILQTEIEKYLHSDEIREILIEPVSSWMKPVALEIEKYTVPICVRHKVPYKALSLNSYFSTKDINLELDTKDVLAIEEMSWLINAIVSLTVGFLCGGSGIALIANGLPGIVAGVAISLIVLLLGKERMQEAFLNADIPLPVRKLIPKSYFASRIKRLTTEVKKKIYENLEDKKDEEITNNMINDISSQIEQCLTKMAEVVEIPLG